jgi:hypothetical protein
MTGRWSKKTFGYKNEVYLEKFSVNNSFIILYLEKNTNDFRLYVFDSAGNQEVKNSSTNEFYHGSNLYILLLMIFFLLNPHFLAKSIRGPTSLTDAAKKKEKCYYDKSQSNNNCTNPNFTQITIDLETYIP